MLEDNIFFKSLLKGNNLKIADLEQKYKKTISGLEVNTH